jgi:hypothetical protein
VREPRRGLRLVEQPLRAGIERASDAHGLECDGPPEFGVARLVHDAEAAAPDLAKQLEAPTIWPG